jgi:HAD superfamily hydrolase (TIGR01549 family)
VEFEMNNHVDAILFDMGGTLRWNTKRDNAGKAEIIQKILDLLGSDASAEEFTRLLEVREAAYDKWATHNLTELDEAGLWTEWMLPDRPAQKISKLAMQLNLIWRDAIATRTMYPETRATILGLYRRGYRLGLVSNTTSSVDSPLALEKEGIAGCFDTVILSCVVGKRKPGPDILLEAVDRMGISPDRCAYIGDRTDWDVVAARGARFKRTIILRNPRKPQPASLSPEQTPDLFIDNLKELLDIFPALNGKSAQAAKRQMYDISFSTMWGMKKFAEVGDFLLAAPRLGLARIELNHQIRPAMLEGLDLKQSQISSVHEPCPAVIAAEDLRKLDLLISSPDETRRKQGVDSIIHSIDLAHELGAHTVVVHPGQVQADIALENEMRALFNSGQARSPKFFETRDRLVKFRAALVPPYLEAVKRSLLELLDYASQYNIRIGVENRYHYLDLPTLDEMGELLALAGSDRIGFLYDVGHAQTQDRLGFTPHEEWLKRYASRIIGVHLHDVTGVNDHQAPGLGEVDFRMVASYLPKEAYRVLEVQSFNTPEQVKAGLKILVDSGCVNLIE